MLNLSSNPELTIPIHEAHVDNLIEFLHDEDKYDALMEFFFYLEHALYVPNPVNMADNLEQEYWLLMQFLNEEGLAGSFVKFRAEKIKQA